MLKELLAKMKERREMESQMDNNVRAEEKVLARRKTPEEREYESYMEEMRQRKIKEEVLKFRQMKKDEAFHPKQFLETPNMFKEKNYPKILNQPNIFKENKKNMFMDKSIYIK